MIAVLILMIIRSLHHDYRVEAVGLQIFSSLIGCLSCEQFLNLFDYIHLVALVFHGIQHGCHSFNLVWLFENELHDLKHEGLI